MKKNWKALTAVAAVILIVAVAAILINLSPSPAPEARPGALQATGKFGFPVSDIKIGEGGTTKASDGKTITGYNGTCDSAAQAAANYAPLIRDVNVKTWTIQKATLAELAVMGPWLKGATAIGDLVTSSDQAAAAGFDGGWYDRTAVNAGGIYRLVSCDAKKKAVVQVFIGALSAQTKAAPLASFDTVSMELTWKGDWKISDALVMGEDRDFGGRVKDKGPGGPVPAASSGAVPMLTDSLVNTLFESKSRDGWAEYANATR
ncbi:hypothetical protein [Arthrobacter sp. MP_2.3]|uniref:hypothetical protein n=1 Tax=Arthrobacter sp. MP_2.3 TaxID=3349633 RepID=UPI0038D47875